MAVLLEDSAAVAGVFLAGSAIALTHFTGNVIYDALGSLTIGGKLVGLPLLVLACLDRDMVVGALLSLGYPSLTAHYFRGYFTISGGI